MTGQTLMGIATIIAVLIGPIIAVRLTRWLDDKKLDRTRRMDVFRTLMRTRRMKLNADHVGALNLVEIEFYGQKSVIDAWKEYWKHLGEKAPEDKEEQDRFFQHQDGLLTKLLHAIAKSLGFDIEQMEIFEGGYVPQGWHDDESYQRALRYLLIDVLSGKRGLPVVPLNVTTENNPYPPPPNVTQGATAELSRVNHEAS